MIDEGQTGGRKLEGFGTREHEQVSEGKGSRARATDFHWIERHPKQPEQSKHVDADEDVERQREI